MFLSIFLYNTGLCNIKMCCSPFRLLTFKRFSRNSFYKKVGDSLCKTFKTRNITKLGPWSSTTGKRAPKGTFEISGGGAISIQ